MANNPIPVYVFTGFLESGKTKFIQEILADPNFTENEVTALLLCEEGIEEYDEKWLAHYGTALVPIESEDRLTPNILKRIEQKYNPDRIIVEYNGMWKLESLMQAFPARWELYQIITTVDATTFEVYSNNIGPQMFEHITTADMVVFNRCTDALKEMLYKKNIKAMNPRAAIYLDDLNGNSEPTSSTSSRRTTVSGTSTRPASRKSTTARPSASSRRSTAARMFRQARSCPAASAWSAAQTM